MPSKQSSPEKGGVQGCGTHAIFGCGGVVGQAIAAKASNFSIEGRHTVDSCMQLFRKRLYGASMQASKRLEVL